MTTFTQHLLYASIPYIIFIIIFILTYIVFAFEAYYLAASAKYEWARYQRYKRIRDLRLQRNNIEQNEVRIENGNAQWNWSLVRLHKYCGAYCWFSPCTLIWNSGTISKQNVGVNAQIVYLYARYFNNNQFTV